MQTDYFLVQIDFRQIQTWLFSLSVYKIIKGKNAALGEVIRLKLTQLAKKYPRDSTAFPDWLAEETDPPGREDLLNQLLANNLQKGILQDIPWQLYRDTGILSRDGGHFTILLANREHANSFIVKSCEIIGRHLPQLGFSVRLFQLQRAAAGSGWVATAIELDDLDDTAMPATLVDLPVYERCEVSGMEPAVEEERSNAIPGRLLGAATFHFLKKGERFNRKDTVDVAGLMQAYPMPDEVQDREIEDLSTIANGDYLALVVIDGNQTGKRLFSFLNQLDQVVRDCYIQKEQHTGYFFYRSRANLRAALGQALEQVFPQRKGYSLLMVGGDDIALVCQSKRVFEFVQVLIDGLDSIQQEERHESLKQTLSVGVAIAHPKFPMNDWFEHAEQMLASAKKVGGHAIDWQVIKSTTVNHIFEERQQSCVYSASQPVCCYSLRPYAITGNSGRSFKTLVADSQRITAAIGQALVARRQLKALAATLPEVDFAHALLLWHELPLAVQQELASYRPQKVAENLVCSGFMDLLDIVETGYLGDIAEETEQSVDLDTEQANIV